MKNDLNSFLQRLKENKINNEKILDDLSNFYTFLCKENSNTLSIIENKEQMKNLSEIFNIISDNSLDIKLLNKKQKFLEIFGEEIEVEAVEREPEKSVNIQKKSLNQLDDPFGEL